MWRTTGQKYSAFRCKVRALHIKTCSFSDKLIFSSLGIFNGRISGKASGYHTFKACGIYSSFDTYNLNWFYFVIFNWRFILSVVASRRQL
jgi:hypothetical protein